LALFNSLDPDPTDRQALASSGMDEDLGAVLRHAAQVQQQQQPPPGATEIER
jgi:hypothetical protein